MKQRTVTINGMIYDTRTGVPVRNDRSTHQAAARTANTIHTPLQKSRTLNRKYVTRETAARPQTTQPAPAASQHTIVPRRKPAAKHFDIARPQHITRFESKAAPQPTQVVVQSTPDIAPTAHPLMQRVEQRATPTKPTTHHAKPSDIIKREAIEQAVSHMPAKHTKKEVKQPRKRSKASRFTSIASVSMAVLLLGAYFTYISMPALSTRVAAAQAGFDASYPSYQPSGYSLSGPVAVQSGNVTMKFAANGGPQNYTLTQSKSGWDSSAVLSNYVIPKAGSNYSTSTVGGLTLYNYGDTTVWVNGGVLHTISGKNNLSTEQIQHIATSL